ncbi:N-acyl homoserine lactonase family protein [Gordonia sp. TBRC 11910]|uniref:N-acyl homoserine lactonase family protein n=1 Tax=Gordonia asplenii TaxID=2725283 RepID=A0A848L3A5_9ACTN|nr:N-acyl homoserine lactonase family protein [Gordonia asplenii]NMO03083.1 N-acyl homoserine lactonase family protein [Gordonia asplenii]
MTARRLIPLAGASITLDSGLITMGTHGPLTVPIPTFLIEHDRGLVLFDTGLVPDAWNDPRSVYGDLVDIFSLDCPPENTLENQIVAAGYQLSDVTHVVISHSHFDHTGGMYLFPNAEFYMSEVDIRYAFWPDPPFRGFYRPADFEPTRDFSWNPLREDLDLFGDGSLVLYQTPGHTPGEISLLVGLESQKFLITGDTVHLRSGVAYECPCPVDYNGHQAIESIQRIKQLASSQQARIWVLHDPEDWAELGSTVHS